MKKLPVLILLSVFVVRCGVETKKKPSHSAIGEVADVMIFTDQNTLNECHGLIDSIWGKPMPTVAYESTFQVRTSEIKDFDGYTQKNYNLFILVHKENWDKMKPKMNGRVVAAVNKAFDSGYKDFALKDVFVQPQIVYFVVAENMEQMKVKLRESQQELLSAALEIEKKTTIESLIRTRLVYDSFYHRLLRDERFAFRRPDVYDRYIENTGFHGISRYAADKHAGVYAYSEPYSGPEQFTKEYIIHLRDSMLKLYIKGPKRPDGIDTYMQTAGDQDVPLMLREIAVNDLYAVELKGWWEMENEYMGGPFVSYTIHCPSLNRVVTLEGNVFAPNRSKRKLMRECELIMSTFTVKEEDKDKE